MSRSFKAILVLILAATLARAQQPAREVAAGQPKPEWVVSVIHTIDAQTLIKRLRDTKTRVGVSGTAPQSVYNVATGLVVDESGHIITRLANVDPEDKNPKISVTTTDGKSLTARLVGIDCATGFAVIEASSLKVSLPSAAAAASLVNDMTVTILSTDVKSRVVASSGVEKTYLYPAMTQSQGLIKTDSLLTNVRGSMLLVGSLLARNDSSVVTTQDNQVIGIAEYTGYGRANLYPIGFIRDTVARRVIEKQGTVPAGWLGVVGRNLAEVPETELATLGLQPAAGVIVMEITPDSPAAASGLAVNDVIVGLDNIPIIATEDLRAELRRSPAGRDIRLRAIRNRQPVEISVVLGAGPVSLEELSILGIERREAPASERDLLLARLNELRAPYNNLTRSPAAKERDEALRELTLEIRQIQDRLTDLDLREQTRPAAPRRVPDYPIPDFVRNPDVNFPLGFTGRDLGAQLAQKFNVSGGILVSGVAKESRAALAGIQAGDVIVGADKQESLNAILLLAALSRQQEDISLKVMRRGEAILITIKKQQ